MTSPCCGPSPAAAAADQAIRKALKGDHICARRSIACALARRRDRPNRWTPPTTHIGFRCVVSSEPRLSYLWRVHDFRNGA